MKREKLLFFNKKSTVNSFKQDQCEKKKIKQKKKEREN